MFIFVTQFNHWTWIARKVRLHSGTSHVYVKDDMYGTPRRYKRAGSFTDPILPAIRTFVIQPDEIKKIVNLHHSHRINCSLLDFFSFNTTRTNRDLGLSITNLKVFNDDLSRKTNCSAFWL